MTQKLSIKPFKCNHLIQDQLSVDKVRIGFDKRLIWLSRSFSFLTYNWQLRISLSGAFNLVRGANSSMSQGLGYCAWCGRGEKYISLAQSQNQTPCMPAESDNNSCWRRFSGFFQNGASDSRENYPQNENHYQRSTTAPFQIGSVNAGNNVSVRVSVSSTASDPTSGSGRKSLYRRAGSILRVSAKVLISPLNFKINFLIRILNTRTLFTCNYI